MQIRTVEVIYRVNRKFARCKTEYFESSLSCWIIQRTCREVASHIQAVRNERSFFMPCLRSRWKSGASATFWLCRSLAEVLHASFKQKLCTLTVFASLGGLHNTAMHCCHGLSPPPPIVKDDYAKEALRVLRFEILTQWSFCLFKFIHCLFLRRYPRIINRNESVRDW